MKSVFFFISILVCLPLVASAENIQLPAPDMQGGIPLMQALSQRHTTRVFAQKDVDARTLGDLLWAAWGVNRADGHRTAPSAMNVQNIDIYVVKTGACWRYDAANHTLTTVEAEAKLYAMSPFPVAPVTLLFVAHIGDKARSLDLSCMHVGSIYQNSGLFCASKGLNNVVRTGFDREAVGTALHLPENTRVLAAQSIGWPEN